MKKTIFLLPKEKNPTTGGQQYDIHFTQVIKQIDSSVEVVTDDKLAWNSRISFLYNFIYLFKLKTFRNADLIITNSRLYPRLFFFLSILKFLNTKTKLICIHHHYNFLTHSGVKRSLNKYFEIKFLKMFSGIIIPSKYVKTLTENLLDNPKIYLLEIGFDKKPRKYENKTSINKLLYVGTIEKRKGIHLLLEALKEVREEYELNLIGGYKPDNDYYLSLLGLLKDNNLKGKVFFRGRVSNEELRNYYMQSSVFVFPSLHEGYGMVIIEAMSYGLPVIAFNNSAIPYLVKDNYNGLLAENQNFSEMQVLLNKILKDTQLLNNLKENALRTFNEVKSSEDLVKDIKIFYEKIFYEN